MSFALATVETDRGSSAALVVGEKIIVLADAAADLPNDVRTLIARWDELLPRLDALARDVERVGAPLAGARLLAPIADPGAIYCAGANYQDHAEEMAARTGRPKPVDPHTLGQRSWHFMKTRNCIVGPGAEVRLHPRSKKVDWEAELAVVIGRQAFQVAEADALNYVFGYTAANDLSARDLARREELPESSSFRNDWVTHKVWDGSCPLGPWIALARDISDPHDLSIALDVNGVVKQQSNSGKMIFDIREQIADLSRNFTLWPGDVILTGTPAGVGAGRGEFLNKGDVVRIRIGGIGELVHTMN
jgi:2-keto-4-pentenoate hydratase/2-oxohepta-3-ene-1,7-dioic acid hydratase in catechol pathway